MDGAAATQIANDLINAPFEAIRDPQFALAFTVLEYASDWAQVTAMAAVGEDYKRLVGAVVRGFFFQTSLVFWEGPAASPA